jgi:hypothetical protein
MCDDDDDLDEVKPIDEQAARVLVERHAHEYEVLQLEHRCERAELEAGELRLEVARLERDLLKERRLPFRHTNVQSLLETIEILSRQHGTDSLTTEQKTAIQDANDVLDGSETPHVRSD